MSNNWFSARFQKRVYLTRHAETRMQQRLISEEVVTDLIETGMLKYKDDQHSWIYKEYVARNDNLLCAAVVAADTVIINHHESLAGGCVMKTAYYPEDDILVLHLSDDPVAKEISPSWNVNISYTAQGEIAEIVILEAKEKGLYPVVTEKQQAA